MTALRVGFVCQWYEPEPVLQPLWIVDALRDRGLEVTVLTAFPNYPDGKLHDGFTGWRPRSERIRGVTVHRSAVYPSHDRSAARRILTYLSWAASSTAIAADRLRDVDVVLVYSSPATAALPAMWARLRQRTPYVLLVQDVWPDSVSSSGFMRGRAAKPLLSLLDRFVDRTYRAASTVAVISPGMGRLLRARGVSQDKIAVVRNWVRRSDETVVAESLRGLLGLARDDFLILYAGNHGAAQNLAPVVSALVNRIDRSEKCHLVLVGDGVVKPDLQELARHSDRVHFLPPVPSATVGAWAGEVDAQLVSLADEPLFAITIPSKVQAILAAGRPVIAVAKGDVADIVTDAGCGVTAEPGDEKQVATAILAMRGLTTAERSVMGARGRAYYETTMSEEVGGSALEALLRRAAEDPSAGRRR